eukprot:scaffold2921_cov61-Phaeocystis_antarctica.AAC.4
METLDDDIRHRAFCDRVSSVHEPHRKKWQLAQTLRLHWNVLELRKPGDPALRIIEPLHDGPSPAPAYSEHAIHDAAPFHAVERSEATLSPAARNQPRLERKRVLAQLEHQAKMRALAQLLGVDQEHAGAKMAPLQDVKLLPEETRVYAAMCLVEVFCPDQIRWITEIDRQM